MAKDTRGLPGNEPVKKDIAAKAEASDAKIVSQAKDMTPEQVDAANATRLADFTPSVVNEPTGTVDPVALKRSRKAGMDPVEGPKTVFVPKGTDPEEVISRIGKRTRKRRGRSSLVPPTPQPQTPAPGREKRESLEKVGTGRTGKVTPLDFGMLPSRPASGLKKDVTQDADVAENLVSRIEKGMGLPGSENGILDLALKLHESDRQAAIATNKTVNTVEPNDPAATHVTVYGKHHHEFAKVMGTMQISDPELYKRAASATGQRLDHYISSLHTITQEHEDSKRTHTFTDVKPTDSWQHPTTGKIHRVSENHPDMPAAFTRTKGRVAKVSRNEFGDMETKFGHEGWDTQKLRGGSRLFKYTTAPKGIDYVDHLRAEMTSTFGPSATSRSKGASKASNIVDEMAASSTGVVPRGMQVVGQEKTAVTSPIPKITSRPKVARDPQNRRRVLSHGSSTGRVAKIYTPRMETTEELTPILGPKPKYTNKTGKAPYPPKAKFGEVLVGDASSNPKPVAPRSRQFEEITSQQSAMQPTLPGTGVPKIVSSMVAPAKTEKVEGPLRESDAAALDLSLPLPKPPKGSAAEQLTEQGEPPVYNPQAYADKQERQRKERNKGLTEDALRTRVTEPAKYESSVIPTDREWKRTEQRSQQFAINTEGMTGAQEVKAIAGQGGLSSQRELVASQSRAGKELVVRPGGAKQARKDARAAKSASRPKKAPEQLSLFTDADLAQPRSKQFYMQGEVQKISEKSKELQGAANMAFGRQPNNKDYETENEQSAVDSLTTNIKGEPNTSDAMMKQWRASNKPTKRSRKPKKSE